MNKTLGAMLGTSGLIYAEVTRSQALPSWIGDGSSRRRLTHVVARNPQGPSRAPLSQAFAGPKNARQVTVDSLLEGGNTLTQTGSESSLRADDAGTLMFKLMPVRSTRIFYRSAVDELE